MASRIGNLRRTKVREFQDAEDQILHARAYKYHSLATGQRTYRKPRYNKRCGGIVTNDQHGVSR